MKIRKAQMQVFEAHSLSLVPKRLQILLSNRLPDRRHELVGPAGLSRIEAAVDRARERGFLSERAAAKFVTLAFVLGDGFAAEPWAAAILDDATISSASERIDLLWEAAKSRELAEAARDLSRASR